MKKLSIVAAAIASTIVLSAGAGAVDGPEVLTLDVTTSGSKINYSGTMEDGSHAVKCWLYDSSDNELKMLSSAVDNHEFANSFTITDNDDYTVTCANYEGGNTKSETVTVNRVSYSLRIDLNGGTAKSSFSAPDSVYDGDVIDLSGFNPDDIVPPAGKEFDAFEINGRRYEISDQYTVTGATTIKLLWKDKAATTPSANVNTPLTFDVVMTYAAIFAASVAGIAIAIFIVKRNIKHEA